jgi:hypothetical protein
MNADQLKDALRRLKSELEGQRPLDGELRGLLRDLDQDIHQALAGEGAGPSQGLIERAEALEVKFAAKHPEVEGVLREVIDALARMGI